MSRRSRHDSDPPPSRTQSGEQHEERRSRLESVIPELIKKAVVGGFDRASEARETIKDFITESKLPKEIAGAILNQVDETKNGLFRVVAKEVRGFLEAIDFQRELQKLLTTVSFEIKTEIRFIPNDTQPDRIGRPEVKAAMKVKRQRDESKRGGKKSGASREDEREEARTDDLDHSRDRDRSRENEDDEREESEARDNHENEGERPNPKNETPPPRNDEG